VRSIGRALVEAASELGLAEGTEVTIVKASDLILAT
jgi:hypothetical protein